MCGWMWVGGGGEGQGAAAIHRQRVLEGVPPMGQVMWFVDRGRTGVAAPWPLAGRDPCVSQGRRSVPARALARPDNDSLSCKPCLQVAAELPVTAGAPDARTMAAAAAAAAVVREAAAAAVAEHLEGESGTLAMLAGDRLCVCSGRLLGTGGGGRGLHRLRGRSAATTERLGKELTAAHTAACLSIPLQPRSGSSRRPRPRSTACARSSRASLAQGAGQGLLALPAAHPGLRAWVGVMGVGDWH